MNSPFIVRMQFSAQWYYIFISQLRQKNDIMVFLNEEFSVIFLHVQYKNIFIPIPSFLYFFFCFIKK